VRVPGENGMKRYRDQQAHGVLLFEAILPSLEPWGAKLGVAPPTAS
jgi:hypothetical protein